MMLSFPLSSVSMRKYPLYACVLASLSALTAHVVSDTNAAANLEALIAEGAAPRLLADGYKFTEGPAADASGNIYFADIGNNRIHYWDIRSKSVSTIREGSGGANGMFVERDGNLLICEMRNNQLTRLRQDGALEVLEDDFEGKPFTGVNDLWIDPYGGIYFSDSYFGSALKGNTHRVFYRSPEGELSLVADDFYKSNGLQGTRDGKWLYIADYYEKKVYRYSVIEPGKLGERSVFAEYRCDGLTLDEKGNLYLCTGNQGNGIVVIDPRGRELGKIAFPENPANVCFGGEDYSTLFVAATHGFYSLEMKVRGNAFNSPQKPAFVDDGGLSGLVAEGAELERLAYGFKPAQGPTMDAEGNVYFADIYHHKIMKWDFGKKELSLVREQPGGPDGLFVEADGSLLVCELKGLRFARLSPDGVYSIIADSFEGKPLTGPNDVYVDDEGGIYFSDSYPGSKIRHPASHCVYYIPPGSDKLKRIVDDHFKTKGMHVSADRKWIYIADYGGRKVYRYPLLAPGVLGEKELFIDTRCGGLTVDEKGNLYISTVGDLKGILVFDPEGNQIGQIMYPEPTTNAVFAGPNRDQLIVTTFKSLYSLKMKVKGMHQSL